MSGAAMASFVSSPTLSLVALTLAIIGTLSFQATFWAVPPSFLTGRSAAAGIAFIVAVGNLGGFAGPYLIGRVKEATNSYAIALLVLVLELGRWRGLGALPHAQRALACLRPVASRIRA